MKKSAKNTVTEGNTFSDEERAAMRERVLELKANKNDGEKLLLERIAKMPEPDRSMAKKVHALIMKNAPSLSPKTWYGMPAYANNEGKVICFFQDANKFKARYATLGFSDSAKLDEGEMWPTSYALKKLGPKEEAQLTTLVKKAIK